MAERNIYDLAYGGKYHDQGWNINLNKNATIPNCRSNCTTAVIQECLIEGYPLPVGNIPNASNWHKYLINGWKDIPFDKSLLHVGDIVEWSDKCHVAIVADIIDGEPYLNCSWYTGVHGKAVWNGKWDTRPFNSLKEVSDFMVNNYPYRFYHYVTVETESNGVGGAPEHILVNPQRSLKPVDKDSSKDQIQVLTDSQNIRNSDFVIIGVAQSGYYNVYGQVDHDGYTWYQVAENAYIAGVKGRVIYIPKTDGIDWEAKCKELEKENKALKETITEINKLSTLE